MGSRRRQLLGRHAFDVDVARWVTVISIEVGRPTLFYGAVGGGSEAESELSIRYVPPSIFRVALFA
jgi:hypothetical protein